MYHVQSCPYGPDGVCSDGSPFVSPSVPVCGSPRRCLARYWQRVADRKASSWTPACLSTSGQQVSVEVVGGRDARPASSTDSASLRLTRRWGQVVNRAGLTSDGRVESDIGVSVRWDFVAYVDTTAGACD
jgi:hypothetical protein